MTADDPLADITQVFSPLSQPFQAATKQLTHPGPVLPEAQYTDAAHAQNFAISYGVELRYHHRRGVWLWYDPPVWRPDGDGKIYRQAILFAKRCQQDALEIRDRKVREQALQFFIRQEGKGSLDRTISLARNLEPLADSGDGWDAHAWRIGAVNGVIDLRSGLLEPGDPAYKMSFSTRVAYDETADCPRWRQFLKEIFDGDAGVIAFVQRYGGYALTGLTTEQILAVFYGRGANGKSTLINTLAWVLGDYAHNMPFSTVELKQRSSIPNDMAALDGKRFVTASETSDGTRLNEARIKTLTGSDPITARFMHSEFFTFQPVAKFVLAVNHKPAVADDSYGFWRRIRLVPFLRTFSGSVRDDQLEAKLRAEGSGILRWLVEGCLIWKRDGLPLPSPISEATDAYQADSDPLADFLDEACDMEATAVTAASELQEGYQKWCDKRRLNKAERLNSKDFGRRMADRFDRKHTNTGWKYYGVKLLTSTLW